MIQSTFLMIKTNKDGELPKIKDIVKYISKKLPEGFTIDEACEFNWARQFAEEHYAEHKGKNFFEELIGMITNGSCYGFVVRGENAVEVVRKLAGSKADKDKNNEYDNPMRGVILPEKGSLRYEIPLIDQFRRYYGRELTPDELAKSKVQASIWFQPEGEAIAAMEVAGRRMNVVYSKSYNAVHSSDSLNSADREIQNFRDNLSVTQPRMNK